MTVTILTLFPDMFQGPFDHSIIKRAQEKGLVTIRLMNIRDFGLGKHKMVDDTPYGGGIGMLMRVDVVAKAIESARMSEYAKDEEKVLLTNAAGKSFSQPEAKRLSTLKHVIIVCGHYEGIDERIREYIDEEISIGPYVLTGGEIPAMVITDTISRLIPGVITEGATEKESFSLLSEDMPLLEYPQYTKPQEFKGQTVPDVLLSGHHKNIDAWRLRKAREKTKKEH